MTIRPAAAAIAIAAVVSSHGQAGLTTFEYTQTDSVTGSGGGNFAPPAGGWDCEYAGDVDPVTAGWDHNNGSDAFDGTTVGVGNPGYAPLTDGVTLDFRTRVATPGEGTPRDDYRPDGGGAITPWPATGDSYAPHNDGKSVLSIRDSATRSRSAGHRRKGRPSSSSAAPTGSSRGRSSATPSPPPRARRAPPTRTSWRWAACRSRTSPGCSTA